MKSESATTRRSRPCGSAPATLFQMSDIAELVELLYQEVLGRESDPVGAQGWIEAIEGGVSVAELISGLLGTEEAQRVAATRKWFARPQSTERSWAVQPIRVTDVGAAPLDYEDDVYAALMHHEDSTLVCFEPDRVRAARARDKHQKATVVELCVGDGSRRPFYETIAGVTSSLYEPNPRTTIDLLEVRDEMTMAEVRDVETTRLDDVAAARGTEFLKLDVQGAEADVLRHGKAVLDATLAVHTEMEFFPLYIDQPLGWEPWRELHEAGFQLYWFEHLQPYTMRSEHAPTHRPGRRLGWGDAVFFPSAERIFELDEEASLRLATIWDLVYDAADLCDWLFEQHPDAAVRSHRRPSV